MKMALRKAYVIGAILALGSQAIYSQEQKPESPGLTPAVVAQLNMANKLIALGDARKDPLLLIAAAKIQKNLGVESADLPPQDNATKSVLERAKSLSAGRKDLIGIIDDILAMRSKSSREDCNGMHKSTVCLDKTVY